MGAESSSHAGAANEKSQLDAQSPGEKIVGYGGLEEGEKVTSKEGLAKAYDIEELSTMRVFGVAKGTVLKSETLWRETGILAVLYWGLFAVMFANRFKDFSEFVGKESSIRAFIAMFSTLIGLLLSFYTALNLGRWWHMRQGMENMQEGCKKLTMFASQVTQDHVLHETIHRYARASLFLVFAASRNKDGNSEPRLEAVKLGLLTEEEASKLEIASKNKTYVQAETLWVWLAGAVTRMHSQGLTKGAPHYCVMLAAVDQGRNGVNDIQAYLETPIPLGYVHLLCLMVKLHNLIVTILMAMTTVKLAGGEKGFQAVGVFRTAFRAFFMPFLYNAILILNTEVTDPFGDDAMDFDFMRYDVNMLMSAKSYRKASESCPGWLENRTFAPIPKEPAAEQA